MSSRANSGDVVWSSERRECGGVTLGEVRVPVLKRATIIRRQDAASALALNPAELPSRRGPIVRRAVVEAKHQAQTLIEEAEARARSVTESAERDAEELKRAASELGRAEGFAEPVARAASIGQMEADADQRALSRTVALARLLAERLLGSALQLDETSVIALAQRALNEVKAVRQVRLVAHPDDCAVLQAKPVTSQPGFALASDAGLARGDFRIVTDVGTIEASLGARLDLLAARVADGLKKGA